MSDKPLILLGMDAGDIVLIEQWAAQGLLPTFAALLSSAAHGRLDTSASVLQASVWPSFATACNPGKHGSYFMMQMHNGTNNVSRIRADHLRRPPFWAWFEGAAETAVIVDVPKMLPLASMNGVQVIEWGTVDHYWQYATVPAALTAPLLREFGPHPLLQERRPPTSIAGCLRLNDHLLRGVSMKHRLHVSFIERYQPRVFVSVFGEPHLAGHYFWRFFDEKHPNYCQHPQASRALLQIYTAIDQAVGEIFHNYSHRANCFVFSGHGMSADYQPHSILDDLLCRMGLTVRRHASAASCLSSAWQSPTSLMRAMSNVFPQPMKRFANRYLLPARAREFLMLTKALSGIDFARTQAFALPTDLQGFIRLNLQGREPDGTVSPHFYDTICDTIEQELQALQNSSTGEKLVESVFRLRTIYSNADNLQHLPDLCVLWKNTYAVSEVYSPRYGTFAVHKKHPERSGNHRLEGFYFAAGPDIDTTVQHYRGQLYDIAATVFCLMNKPIPPDWDGTPLPIIA
jgi:predicted AlkP superfamily phosphohydrolase/phosphomutase